MKQQPKQPVKPVSVSQTVPVYNNGRIIAWNVHVFFDGDLSTNTAQRNKWRELIDKNPHLVWEDGKMLNPILKKNIIIPNERHLTGLFRYNPEKNVSELEWSWRDGLFGCGAERAWQFRIKILAQINKQRVK